MHFFGEAVSNGSGFFLVLAVALALGFECVNGFHDTANAVATVIYTHSLRPWIAVVWSGIWNLIGVLVSTGGVAYGVIALLPVELVLHVGSAAGYAMVFALLISAIIWNLGTWYMGLPASSSHSLIGAIVGRGAGQFADAARPPLRRGRELGQGGEDVHGAAHLADHRVRLRGRTAAVAQGDGQAAGPLPGPGG